MDSHAALRRDEKARGVVKYESAHSQLSVRLAEDVIALFDALAVAVDLLRTEGYDTDPDYRQEWQTVEDGFYAR